MEFSSDLKNCTKVKTDVEIRRLLQQGGRRGVGEGCVCVCKCVGVRVGVGGWVGGCEEEGEGGPSQRFQRRGRRCWASESHESRAVFGGLHQPQ